MVNPEPAKQMSEVFPCIERWEERLQRLDDKERPTEDMQLALLSRICPKQLQAYVELHLTHITTYAQMTEGIMRVIEACDMQMARDKAAEDFFSTYTDGSEDELYSPLVLES